MKTLGTIAVILFILWAIVTGNGQMIAGAMDIVILFFAIASIILGGISLIRPSFRKEIGFGFFTSLCFFIAGIFIILVAIRA